MELPRSLMWARLAGSWRESRRDAMRLARKHSPNSAFFVEQARFSSRMVVADLRLARAAYASELKRGMLDHG